MVILKVFEIFANICYLLSLIARRGRNKRKRCNSMPKQDSMLKIGNISLDMPFMQASLSGYSDRPMRVLAWRFGSPLSFTGVFLDKNAVHLKAAKKLLFAPQEDEGPVAGQILGRNPATMAAAAAAFEQLGYPIIDLNFACPAPKVLRRGRGGALLQKPETAIEIFRQVRDRVACPVTIKLRTGFDSSEASREDFWRLCTLAAEGGVDALFVHGRTVKQKYRGRADWQTVAEVKRRFPDTTVIGSGDLLDAEAAVERLRSTGIDGVIIARGAIGNPWIFSELRAMLEGKPKPQPPTIAEQGRVMLEHFEMISQMREMIKAVRYFRKFSVNYCRRHPERKKAQMALLKARSKEEVQSAIKHFYGT